MAIRASHGRVGSGERETGVAMFDDGKSGAMKILNRMATFAFVLIGRWGKLAVVGILMAVQAGREFYLVDRVFAGGQMAFATLDGNVFSLQRVIGSVMLLHAKERWLPTFHGMAFRAFPLLRPSFKLAFVRVGFMAVRAIRKGQLFFEIAVDVTLGATDRRVLSE